MVTPNYYYVIIGGGLAGLQLALRISKDIFFKGKKIAIIEPSLKNENDKTWCFWEKGQGEWDHLITKKWDRGLFITSEVREELHLKPYAYKMLKSIDFYNYVKSELENAEDIVFIQDEIEKIDPVTRTAHGKNDFYTATHFFDSRPPEDYKKNKKASVIFQHFKGITIKTKNDQFEDDVFTMMDYRIKYKNSTCFTYVLPISSKEALIEFTFFTPFLTDEKVYDQKLKEYITSILKIKNYEIAESEMGVIPMTDHPFHHYNSKYITKIGTAGGWVKASSGYSFKSTEEKVEQLIENIKRGFKPSANLLKSKYLKYDAIFLDVLAKRNDLGESLFTRFYTKNSIQDIFRFLDEETKMSEEIKIMLSLYHPQFLKSFFKKL